MFPLIFGEKKFDLYSFTQSKYLSEHNHCKIDKSL
jgi:hypothetical protein